MKLKKIMKNYNRGKKGNSLGKRENRKKYLNFLIYLILTNFNIIYLYFLILKKDWQILRTYDDFKNIK
jgi:hypothetical protein